MKRKAGREGLQEPAVANDKRERGGSQSKRRAGREGEEGKEGKGGHRD